MFTWLFFAAVGFAFLDWACTWKGWKVRLYIAKPATLLFLILWTVQVSGWQGGMLWFGIGLCLSLAGDIALMLNRALLHGGAGCIPAGTRSLFDRIQPGSRTVQLRHLHGGDHGGIGSLGGAAPNPTWHHARCRAENASSAR